MIGSKAVDVFASLLEYQSWNSKTELGDDRRLLLDVALDGGVIWELDRLHSALATVGDASG
jgi:hypothetical protein